MCATRKRKNYNGKKYGKKLHNPPYTFPAKSVLITPYEITNEKFTEKWSAQQYTGNPYRPEDKITITHKGGLARSKSEKIIADKLFVLNIPYRYEAELILPVTKRTIYPDFTLLRVADRTPIYIEPFGLLGHRKHRSTAFNKMTTYAINGVVPENTETPFTSHHFELLLQSLLSPSVNSGRYHQ